MIAVLDYGIGNLRSAQKALVRVGADARLVSRPADAEDATAVVLPGVGAFGACVRALRASGLDQVVADAVAGHKPLLGVCVGMQMLYESSEEDPAVDGLGVLPGRVKLLPDGVKRPQMQWNRLGVTKEDPLMAGLDGEWVYFVHSYAAEDGGDTIATCDYGGRIVAAVAHAGIWATQFHPEKSGRVGLRLLENFIRIATNEGRSESAGRTAP